VLRARAEHPQDHLAGTADEMAGWSATEVGKWVRARELGEKIVREHPDSFAGHYVLGVAFHYGEGDLARSVYHLDLAARQFERRYGPKPPGDTPWRWHEATLRELAQSWNEMDQPREQLAVLERYDAAYQPKRLAQRVWPLMKLRRYDESRAQAKLAVATGRSEQQRIARSDLCAAECEAGDRQGAWRACNDSLAEWKARPTGGQVEFSNTAEAALAVYKFDEAERLLAESTKRASPDSWGNPFSHIAGLYLSEGRVPEAIESLRGAQELRLRRPAWLDQHGQARLDWTVASLLLVVGETERAEQIAERAQANPDRQGVHSGTEAQADSATAVLVAMTRRELGERMAEDAAAARLTERWKLRWRALVVRLRGWQEARRAAVLLADEEMLVRTMRPYYVGGSDLPEWMVPEVVDIVGAGVALRAIARARAVDSQGAAPAYYDALEAEAEFSRGHDAAALRAAERAVSTEGGLPRAEALVIARAAAIAAELRHRRGDEDQAAAHWATVFARDPDVLRRLGLRLPARLETDASPLAREAARLLAASPRFRLGAGRHTVHLSSSGDGASACLLGPSHEVVQCATLRANELADAREAPRRLVAAFQRAAFACKADLAQSDLTSLDGSPTAERADRQVKSLLDSLGPSAP
jgi:hypothetical protein